MMNRPYAKGLLLCIPMLMLLFFLNGCSLLADSETADSISDEPNMEESSITFDTSSSFDISNNLYTGTATADSFSGEVSVTITIDECLKIVDVDVEEHDTAGMGSRAAAALKDELMGAPSIMIDDESGFSVIAADAVTGATITSKALISAAKEAYIIALAKSEGMITYDALNPICGIWQWDSSDYDFSNSIWCLYPDGAIRVFVVYDDSEWEYAYKHFYESFTSITNYSYSEGNIIWLIVK